MNTHPLNLLLDTIDFTVTEHSALVVHAQNTPHTNLSYCPSKTN